MMNAAESMTESAPLANTNTNNINSNSNVMSPTKEQQQQQALALAFPPEEAGREQDLPQTHGQESQPFLATSPSSTTNGGSSAIVTQTAMDAHLNPRSVATLSQAWEYNDMQDNCYRCSVKFTLLERKHHCRYCGKIFCHACSHQKALIPPSAIVLVPKGGKQVTSRRAQELQQAGRISFNPDDDPDRMLTYVASGSGTMSAGSDVVGRSTAASAVSAASTTATTTTAGGEVLLYGKGLEERFQLAREPLRVCRECHLTLQPLQAELQRSNSHAMRFNHIDPTDPRRLFNSPLAFTLGHEVRKAAYSLNNLLPQPRRRLGATMEYSASDDTNNFAYAGTPGIHQQCQQECSTLSPTMSQLDGLRIPAKLLEQAKGIAVLTVVKGGFGLAGCEFGTGLVVARLGSNGSSSGGNTMWSAPSAIGTAGLSWGALLGAQISDHVFVMMTEESVEMMMSSKGSVQLGADIGVAVGPVGRALEADYGASPHHVAPIYTYSLSKGLYAGVSLDGKVIVTRHSVNEKFYGRRVAPEEILQGLIPTPPAAQPLYDALTRCQVYTQPNFHARRSSAAGAVYSGNSNSNAMNNNNINYNMNNEGMEYGEWQPNPSVLINEMSNMNLGASGMSVNSNTTMNYPYNDNVSYDQQPSVMQQQQQQHVVTQNNYNLTQSMNYSPQQVQQPMMMPAEQQQQQQQQQQLGQQMPIATPHQQQPQPTFAQLPPLPTDQQHPPAANDQHSYAGLSDITSDPGY